MRLILALAAAAGVGALGALILGEYEFKGITILATGVIFGLFIAEAALAVNRRAGAGLGAGAGLIGLAAMTWGAWITTFHHLSVLPGAGWAAVILTGAAAGLRAGWSRPARDTPAPAPAPAAASEEERP